jgi:mRNA interferase MazF
LARKAAPRCPEAGDLIKIDFSPQAGREFRGYHPALVLSPREYNAKSKLCVLCPITSIGTGDSFEVPIPMGLKIGGVVISDQPKSISWFDRKAEFFDVAPESVLEGVRGRIAALIGIDAEDVEDADEENAA